MKWYRRLAERMWRHRPDRVKVIRDRFTGEPYMIRFRVLDLILFKVRIHLILRPDNEPKLHDHPWPFFHYVLEGGYVEKNDHGQHDRHPGFWAIRGAKYRHAIAKLPPVTKPGEDAYLTLLVLSDERNRVKPGAELAEAWTLVIRGPNLRHWGFHCDSGWIHHTDYERRRNENAGWEC